MNMLPAIKPLTIRIEDGFHYLHEIYSIMNVLSKYKSPIVNFKLMMNVAVNDMFADYDNMKQAEMDEIDAVGYNEWYYGSMLE